MPQISTVTSGDYPELAEFLAAFPEDESHSAPSWLDRFRAWWDFNPAYAAPLARGWLLRANGRIAGFFGSIPWKFQLGGSETIVFAGTTWRVLPEHRGMSMMLKRRQMEEHRNALHFSTTPRDEVARMLELLKYEPIRRLTPDGDHSAILLNFRKILGIRFDDRPLGNLVAAGLAPLLGARQRRRLRRLDDAGHDKVRLLARADEAFDELWRRTRSHYANTNVRTAETINWYCFSTKWREKTLLGYYDGARLLGFMIGLSTDMRGMRFFECVDLWIDPESDRDEVLGALVAKAQLCAREGSFDRVFLPHFDGDTAASCERLGLPRMRAWRRPEYFKGPQAMMERITAGNSYFVLAQGDYGL